MQNSRNNPSQKERYQILLKSIIEHCLIHKKHLTPQTSLHQAIQAAQTENITELTHNQLICSIFSGLAALDNVQQALHTAATLYSNYDSIRTTLAHTIQSLDLAFTESEEINNSLLFNKIQENKTLTLFFQDALRVSQFQPKHLPRYLSQPITHDNVTIPAGTNVFIVHRAQEASRDQYAPIFMNNKNAPMLKTTEAAAFSYGNRSCPGNKLTEYVFKSVVAVFIDFMTKNLSLSTTNNSEPSTPRSMR
jgi:cytochrome P450